jgi:hypothetical protein
VGAQTQTPPVWQIKMATPGERMANRAFPDLEKYSSNYHCGGARNMVLTTSPIALEAACLFDRLNRLEISRR